MPVFLWTDILIDLLVILCGATFFYALRNEPLCAAMKQLRKRPMAMAALVILMGYLIIGLLDSVHFRRVISRDAGVIEYDTEILSLLDVIVGTRRTQMEKSYSAPLAVTGYARETGEDSFGKKERIYPRLLYAGANLKNPDDRIPDLYQVATYGAIQGLILALVLFSVGLVFLSLIHRSSLQETAQQIWHGQYETSWKAIFFTTGLLILKVSILAALSGQYHLFGTDKVGQDVFYLSLKAIRTGLVIGTLTTLIMLPFAILLGIMAGYFRGWMDDLIQYIYTTLSSVPGVLLIASAVLILQVYMDTHADDFSTVSERADIRLFFLCLILGMTGWIGLCRLLRGETLKLSQLEYVQAASAMGVPHRQIIVRHILPNVMHLVLISAVLDFSSLVLAEAVLSYVGIGVDPAMISWGNMINSARLEMAREPIVWWSLASVFAMMLGLVLSANIFSDAIRDALDPRARE
jgi:peptide/nickel transport system permease protein